MHFSLLTAKENPVLDQLISRTFIIYLTHSDQDTLRAEYELFKNDCDKPEFKRLAVFYNGKHRPEARRDLQELIILKP